MKVRIMRILIYEGDSKAIAHDLSQRGVCEVKILPKYVIKEAIVGGISDILTELDEEKISNVLSIKRKKK